MLNVHQIHAVLDLLTPPAVVYSFWRINPFEVIIFFVGVFVTIFTSIENGIYCTVGLAGGLMLWRIAKVLLLSRSIASVNSLLSFSACW